ncbi:hypothetical protein DLM_1043 [Aquitalea magnusonii]|jgi:hypothetical protein|uniref:Uncharacterized protein n=1 Tax=Aquitalea magnusonii TaxID=332411 RepID=A0A3G9GD10_9NEIS|nr:hypothetical protein [Aquitalea magnusonii]BBF84683.1 hypothetical protein DLM_1043 [Aquitalea magnusonii]
MPDSLLQAAHDPLRDLQQPYCRNVEPGAAQLLTIFSGAAPN